MVCWEPSFVESALLGFLSREGHSLCRVRMGGETLRERRPCLWLRVTGLGRRGCFGRYLELEPHGVENFRHG